LSIIFVLPHKNKKMKKFFKKFVQKTLTKLLLMSKKGGESDMDRLFCESHAIKKGQTYRVKATVTVWEGIKSETQYVYSPEKTA